MFCSYYLITVSERTKRIDPRNPPTMVINSFEAKIVLPSCIKVINKITKIVVIRSDVLVEIAKISLNNFLLKSL